jgi:2-phosphosulfolactate phosphatase
MKIDVITVPRTLQQRDLENTIVVVIDVLRAASSICTALVNGCSEIIPVADVADAWKAAEIYPRPLVLLAGERNGIKIEGFDLGNSPKEYQRDVVTGKTIVLTTTNGTRALLWAEGATCTLILSLLNLRSVTKYLRTAAHDVLIVCSGQDGEESLEDTVCAGLLVDRLCDLKKDKASITDQARAAMAVSHEHKIDLAAMMYSSPHGAHLQKIGFADDLEICARLNALDVTPIFQNGAIRPVH